MYVILQEKAIAIRIARIAYAFRNGVWPKPMEGLDLFNPTLSEESSDDSSLSEVESEAGGRSDSDFEVVTTRSKKRVGLTIHISAASMGRGRRVGGAYSDGGDAVMDVVRGGERGRRDFEIEKVHLVFPLCVLHLPLCVLWVPCMCHVCCLCVPCV